MALSLPTDGVAASPSSRALRAALAIADGGCDRRDDHHGTRHDRHPRQGASHHCRRRRRCRSPGDAFVRARCHDPRAPPPAERAALPPVLVTVLAVTSLDTSPPSSVDTPPAPDDDPGPLKRRGGSLPPGSPASIPPSKILSGSALSLRRSRRFCTPHASQMQRAHARAEPAFSMTWGDLGRLRAPDSCLTECMLRGAACMLQSIRAYRLEFAPIFRGARPGAYTGFTGAYGDLRRSIHGNPRSIRRNSPEHTPGRTGFRALGDRAGALFECPGRWSAPTAGSGQPETPGAVSPGPERRPEALSGTPGRPRPARRARLPGRRRACRCAFWSP